MVIVRCVATLAVATALLAAACSASFKAGTIGNREEFTISRQELLDVVYQTPSNFENSNPYRIHVWSHKATVAFPVLVVVRQQRRVISWQVPLVVETPQGPTKHQKTARTLCYNGDEYLEDIRKGNATFNENSSRNFTLSLSTSSPTPIEVFVRVEENTDFFIEGDKQYTTTFSASEPVYYSYNFPEAVMKRNDVKTVLIHITSKDETCFVVSVQPKFCPVRDLNDDISYEGKFQTVNTKGGLTISRQIFDDGFYVVFVARGNNFDCSEQKSLLPQQRETKLWKPEQMSTITFEVRTGKTAREYISAIMIVFGVCFGVCLLFALFTYLFYRFGNYRKNELKGNPHPEPVLVSTPTVALLEMDELDTIMKKKDLRVADFVKRGKRNQKKAFNYFYHIANIAIFYGIPVIQLMVAYQRAVDASGDLDLCYHNFHCSQPYYFTDFNHIYSNIGYMLFGLLFILITLFRNMRMKNVTTCGIPKHHGLYYAMGLALIFEGVLSACYHICPTQSNFQFDTSFMYVMAVLIMVKLYQNRHPDINASAYTTFTVLGIAVVLAMFGILYNNLAIMIIFIVCYIILCVYMGFKIYYFGNVVRGWKKIYREYKRQESKVEAIKPIRMGQFIMLLIANIFNICIAITGLALYPNQVDFGTFLLGILMLNAIMYAIFYMVMKLICKERICIEASMYGVLSLLFWIVGSYFFVDYATVWSLTPAESRQLNQECVLLGFYDTHDIWHLLSAPALFFTFMFLQTLDDDLFDKPQSEIDAF